jgi:hypothetical protein
LKTAPPVLRTLASSKSSVVCSLLCTYCSDCDYIEHLILVLQVRHMTILPSIVKQTSVFTHKFNLDTREDAAVVIMISTAQAWTELAELLIQNWNHFHKCHDKDWCCWGWTSMFGDANCNTKECHSQLTLMSGIACGLLLYTRNQEMSPIIV